MWDLTSKPDGVTLTSRDDLMTSGDDDVNITLGLDMSPTNWTAGRSSNWTSRRSNFFDMYYSASRFGVETSLALLSAACNAVILAVIRMSPRRRGTSIYNILFINLATANIISCLLSWLTNNSLNLFHHQFVQLYQRNFCLLFIVFMGAFFVSASFGIVSTLFVFGFATVQYFAICRPLQHFAALRRRRIICFIEVTWCLSLASGIAPIVVVVIITYDRTCVAWILQLVIDVVMYGINTSAAFVAFVYVIIIALFVRICHRMLVVRREMSALRFAQDMRSEKRAIVTIVILLTSFNAFFVPSMVMHVLSLNVKPEVFLNDGVLIYYLNMLPYFKYMSDPVIYGLRMREMLDRCPNIDLFCAAATRCRCCCCIPVRSPRGQEAGSTAVTSFNMKHMTRRSL